jgi:predicted dehydrogenase
MLKQAKLDIACVLISVPLHRQVIEKTVESGALVLCQKPVALSLADTRAMTERCQEQERLLL